MSHLVVILGATGKQGGSVVDAFLSDEAFKVRAVTRDSTSATAAALSAKGAEVVQADLYDYGALRDAFKGASYIYAMTPDIGVNGPGIAAKGSGVVVVEEAYRMEKEAGKLIIQAVNDTIDTVKLFILSSLSAAKELSDHRYELIYHFDAKAELVEYLESDFPELATKTAALQLGMFATNWRMPTPLRPKKQKDGNYKISMPCSPATEIPFIDPNHDPALYVKALASQPLPAHPARKVQKFAGYDRMTTFAEWTQLLNEKLPVEVVYEEVDIDTWASAVTALPGLGRELGEMWSYCHTVGYFGGSQGGTRKITDLRLASASRTMSNFVEEEDWSILFAE